MEHFVNEKKVMQFFLEEIAADNIAYLKGKDSVKKDLTESIEQMIQANTMNDKIQVAIVLWKQLFSAAMSHIDTNRTGYDKLFSYFDEYVEFEELIFASDSFYRDHTLHCLWVYFLGEYLSRQEKFAPLFDRNKRDEWLVESVSKILDDPIFLEDPKYAMIYRRVNAYKDVFQYSDACFCVAALTHDLGYPLKKIEKINKAIKKVLPYYSIYDFSDFSFSYDSIQNNFVSKFLDLLGRKMTINFGRDVNTGKLNEITAMMSKFSTWEKDKNGEIIGSLAKHPSEVEELTQEEKLLFKEEFAAEVTFALDYADYQAMQNDFESYQHGIMSAFLLVKNLEAFQNMHYSIDSIQPADTVRNFGSFTNKQEILKSISNHTRDSFKIRTIDRSETLLTFVDELEEFSRISRASQNREYVEEFCSTRLYMEDEFFCIDFIFENEDLESLDPEKAFKGRCKRFLKLFDIQNLCPELKIRLRCIGKMERNQHVYELQIGQQLADILIDGESQNIPKYLKSNQFYTKEEYATL